jgi:hypothetical protein
MASSPSNIDSEINENISFDSNQISSDEQFSQIIDSINLSATNTDESPLTTSTRTPGQTAIGAKLVKKLETFGILSNKRFSWPKLRFYSSG